MRRLLVLAALVFCVLLNAHGQDTEVTSEEFQLDLTTDTIGIVWEYPVDLQSQIEVKDITVKIGIYSQDEITETRLSLNGISLDLTDRGFLGVKKRFDHYIEHSVTLDDGTNILRLIVVDEYGQQELSERTVLVKSISLEIQNRRDLALLFATDQYDEWDDLVNPINDAQTIERELQQYYNFDTELIINPTQDDILIKIKEYARKSYLQYDQLFIFFAGHGQYDDDLGQGYIVGKNSRLNDIAKSSYLSHSVLRNAIDNIPSRHTLLVMDVCFGGTFDPTIAQSGARGNSDAYKEISTNEYIERKLRLKTRKYITSGGKQYVPDGRPGMHSPFARKLLEGLRSYGGRDDVITLPELITWLDKINPEPRSGGFGTDEPGSDFVFVTVADKVNK